MILDTGSWELPLDAQARILGRYYWAGWAPAVVGGALALVLVIVAVRFARGGG